MAKLISKCVTRRVLTEVQTSLAPNENYKEMNDDKISAKLLKSNCDWVEFRMGVPEARHFGGVWERQIRTVRNFLNALMRKNSTSLVLSLSYTDM